MAIERELKKKELEEAQKAEAEKNTVESILKDIRGLLEVQNSNLKTTDKKIPTSKK